jgi:hypothetical protein
MGENELIVEAIKRYENKYFLGDTPHFCNYNIDTLSTMNVEMHGGGWVVASLMVVEKGVIAVTHTIFLIVAIPPHAHRAWL